MKRLRVILGFLLMGAIVNVAVAWGCAFIHSDQTATWDSSHLGMKQFGDEYIWLVNTEVWTGYSITDSAVFYIVISPEHEEWNDPSTMIESWNRRPKLTDISEDLVNWLESSSGWPCLAMWSRLNILDDNHLSGFSPRVFHAFPGDELEHGVLIDQEFLPKQLILPIGLIGTGFAINTIFYAAILWLLIPGPFVLRRIIRRKRGLCVKCGYDLQGADHEACPECGAECPSP